MSAAANSSSSTPALAAAGAAGGAPAASSTDINQADPAVVGLDDSEETETVNLVPQEGDEHKIVVKKTIAKQSELVKTMVDGDKTEANIPVPNVKATVLKKVLEYLTYHHKNPAKEIEKPLKSANMKENVSEWDATYSEVDQELLFELILASNYMDIKPLLDLTCAKVASMIKGQSPEAIRKKFNISNDFTAEEEAAIKAENKWASESE